MKTYDGKTISSERIREAIRVADITRIYQLYHLIYGGKPERSAVNAFIMRYSPSHRAAMQSLEKACKKVNDRLKRQEQDDNDTLGLKKRIVDKLKEWCADPASPYSKRPMYGHTHLYFCHPEWRHIDYNKWCAIPISGNERFCAMVVRYGDKYFKGVKTRKHEFLPDCEPEYSGIVE